METRMKRSFRDEWTSALRSGEFVQGNGALNRYSKYCCLGVRCELDVRAGTMKRIENDDDSRVLYKDLADPMEFLSGRVYHTTLDRWGLSDLEQENLIRQNDSYHNDFNQIADWIEANVEVEDDD